MRRFIPSSVELAIIATLAVICTGIVAQFHPGTHDLGFAAMAAPMFFIAACMGLRKSPIWMAARQDQAEPANRREETTEG